MNDSVTEHSSNCSCNINNSDNSWKEQQFSGYPVIYPITIYHLHSVIVFGRICHIFWYVIGYIGNLLSLRIWTLARMKRLNSSATYLAGITVCDIVYQILHTFFYLKYFWGMPALGRQVLCQLWNVLFLIPQYASQLLVLGFTMERFISIYKPFHGERFSKRQRAPKVVIIITVIVLVLAMPQAYFWTVDGNGFCEIGIGEDLLRIYTIWSFVTESTIFFIVPGLTLILNIFVLRETHKVINRHRNLNLETNGPSRIHKSSHYKPATKTLLCISFFRIFTQLPVSITYTIQNFEVFSFGQFMPLQDMSNNAQWRVFISYWGARVFIETVGASHFALSLFIFYASTKQFRNEIRKLLNLFKCGTSRKTAQWKHRPGRCTSSDFVYMSSFYKTSDLSFTNNST